MYKDRSPHASPTGEHVLERECLLPINANDLLP